MGQAKLYGQKSKGTAINGVIENYYVYAGENISAGDFVNFVNGVSNTVPIPYGTKIASKACMEIKACQISTNDVAVVFRDNISGSYLGYIVFVTIFDNIIKTSALLNITEDVSASGFDIVQIKNEFILVAYMTNDKGVVRVIYNGENGGWSKGSEYTFDSSVVYDMSIDKVSETKAVIAYRDNGSGNYGKMRAITINNYTLSFGTEYTFYSMTTTDIKLKMEGNSSNYGAVCFTQGSSETNCKVVTISGTTLSVGSNRLVYSGSVHSPTIQFIDTDKILLVYGASSKIRMSVFTRSGTSFIAPPQEYTLSQSYNYIDSYLLEKNKVLLAWYGKYLCILNISDTVVTADEVFTDITFSTETLSYCNIAFVDSTRILTAFRLNSNDYPAISLLSISNNELIDYTLNQTYETQVKVSTSDDFDGIAKTSGVGAPEYVEVETTKTGNIFPTSGWNEEVAYTKYSSDDGYVIEANTVQMSSFAVNLAFNGTLGSGSRYGSATRQNKNEWLMITCPEPTKITKINIATMVYCDATDYKVTVQGSKNKIDWFELAEITTFSHENLSETELANTDFYTYYKIDVISATTGVTLYVDEWQTSEYIVKEQIPSTEHNEQVQIYTRKLDYILSEVNKNPRILANIFPESNWTQVTANTKYSSNGYIIEASGVYSESYPAYYACDGTNFSYWYSVKDTSSWIKMTCPKPIKITKMYLNFGANSVSYISSVIIRGSKDNSTWIDLLDVTGRHGQSSTQFILNTTDYYTYYKIDFINSTSTMNSVRDWRIAEFEADEYIHTLDLPLAVYEKGQNMKLLAGEYKSDIPMLGEWKTATFSAISEIRGVAYGNGLWVIDGSDGKIYTSSDRITWTERTSNTSAELWGLRYVNNKFIACGYDGTIVISDDGITWEVSSTGTTNDIYDVAFCNNMYIAVGESGTILTSTDAINWSLKGNYSTTTLRRICCVDNYVIVVGIGGVILYSKNGGSDWNVATSGTTNNLFGITFDGSQYLVSGASGLLLKSTDAINWSSSNLGVTGNLLNINYTNGIYIISGTVGTFFTSYDATNWEKLTTPLQGNMYIISSHNNEVIIGGRDVNATTGIGAIQYTDLLYTLSSFENPYLDFPTIDPKQINGTIESGNQYDLQYNGESWDIIS